MDTDLAGPAPYPETCWALSRPDALEIRREMLAVLRRTKRINPMPVKRRAASSRPYLSSTRKATTTTANQTSVKQDKNAITAR